MDNFLYGSNTKDLKDNISDKDCKLVYIKKYMKKYYVHIVCCQFSSNAYLRDNWVELINNVAEVVQKSLDKLIEIYNVYIIFFQPNIEVNLANLIEQNKFSSRKLILLRDMPMAKLELENIINSKLFDLKIEEEHSEQFFQDILPEWLITLKDEEFKIKLEEYIENRALEAENE